MDMQSAAHLLDDLLEQGFAIAVPARIASNAHVPYVHLPLLEARRVDGIVVSLLLFFELDSYMVVISHDCDLACEQAGRN